MYYIKKYYPFRLFLSDIYQELFFNSSNRRLSRKFPALKCRLACRVSGKRQTWRFSTIPILREFTQSRIIQDIGLPAKIRIGDPFTRDRYDSCRTRGYYPQYEWTGRGERGSVKLFSLQNLSSSASSHSVRKHGRYERVITSRLLRRSLRRLYPLVEIQKQRIKPPGTII
jgi:hypothetical protein